jgi:hypothetical protein
VGTNTAMPETAQMIRAGNRLIRDGLAPLTRGTLGDAKAHAEVTKTPGTGHRMMTGRPVPTRRGICPERFSSAPQAAYARTSSGMQNGGSARFA